MRKRRSQPGEVGLFIDSPVFGEEFDSIKMDGELKVVVTTPRSLRQHKFIWALATKVAEACDFLDTKEDAYDYMLIEAKHCRFIYDHRREISYARPKATNWGAMDGTAFTKLAKRIVNVVGTHIVPGIDKAELKAEIEKMINPDLIPTMGDRPEPPPVTEIPDGPGIGHNSSNREPMPQPAASQDWQPATSSAPPRASATPTAARRTASPEPRQPGYGPVPDWATGAVPEDPRHYHLYAKFHIDRKPEMGLAMGWLLGDQQQKLRHDLGLGIGQRKQLERYAAEKFGALNG